MKQLFSRLQFKMFLLVAVVVAMTVGFLLVVNSVLSEAFFYNNRLNLSIKEFEKVKQNTLFVDTQDYQKTIEKNAIDNNYDIVIVDSENNLVYSTRDNFVSNFEEIPKIKYEVQYSIFNRDNIMYSKDNVTVRKIQDKINGLNFILLDGELENGDKVYIRMSTSTIEESALISNQTLWIISAVSLLMSFVVIIIATGKFTKPISDLNEIATNMANLDFSKKYKSQNTDDEVDKLGNNINALSDSLEDKINQLRKSNMELERDIEAKAKIDEMRKTFVSDVSHELKTPIALIQGYAEGLVDNVVTDEENRKFYAEVILDESNKMDVLVKRLIELIKLEYDDIKLNDTKFDIVELINETIRTSNVMLNENNIEVKFEEQNPKIVFADDFYIEEVIRNYFTNAIKNCIEVNGKKEIRIMIKDVGEKYRISVFNTGNNIAEEDILRIWNRFYKADKSRDRSRGGHGIGLSLVKAIMNKYNSSYGVKNRQDGVEFFFEISKG
jgi:signal transduction histidine kinase